MKKFFYLLPMLAVLFAGCGEDDPLGNDEQKTPGVTTLDATDVQMFTATLNAMLVLPEQMATDVEFGFEISENQMFPEETTQKLKSKSYDPNFKYSCSIETLDPGTTYYVRAYMANQMGLYQGEIKMFSAAALEIITSDIDTTNFSVTTHVNVQKQSTRGIGYGVCYGTTDVPTVYDQNVTANGVDKDNNYKVTLTNIPYGKTVYYRSYVSIDSVITYGDVKMFIREYNPVYAYVDLGLSVKWATFNVGATRPEEYGDYFTWGDTEPLYESGYAQENPLTHWKDGEYDMGYYWYKYKYSNGNYDALTKYCNKSNYGYNGFTDNKTILDLEDDAAHVNWGGDWRMPTKAEQDELCENCTWTSATMNGVNGYKVQSKKPGFTDKWIFLPAAGYRFYSDLLNLGSYGVYRSSSLHIDSPYYAYDLIFDSDGVRMHDTSRCLGLSVRPVCP